MSLTHSPLSCITSCPSQCPSSTSHDVVWLTTQHVNPPFSRSLIQISPHQASPGNTSSLPRSLFTDSSSDTPVPVLSDIDLNEDHDPCPSPPRPRYSCSPDCVSLNFSINYPLYIPQFLIPLPPPLPDEPVNTPTPSPHPTVAFTGCTDVYW